MPEYKAHLEYKVVGNGLRNIVFLNGFRMKFESWDKVYPDLTSDNRVILYNRRGVGASSKATEPQDGDTVVGDMRAMFSHLGLNAPHFFVAHSLGGLFANLHARTYPKDVAGIVLVDAPHPSELAEQKKNNLPFLVHTINNGMKSIEKVLDEFKYSEDECVDETISQINNAGAFPDIPVAVVSGGKKMPFVPENAFKVHRQYQVELLGLSSKSTHYICSESGHFPQITEPEKVISAIRKTWDEAKIS